MPFYYPFDWTYIILVLPCLFLSLWASAKVNNTFKKYSSQLSSRQITGAQAAQRVLRDNGITDVSVELVDGTLTDHFDPRTNVIRLSKNVYNNHSTAAIGVACHEAGHAVQYATSYFPIKIRAAIIPITNIGSKLAMPLILAGLLFSAFSFSSTIIYLGLACFSFALILQLITLPVEFNASKRAMEAIKNAELLTPDEQIGARKTLQAAAMTYVAATAVSIAQLIRLITIFGNRGRRRN